MAYDIFLKFDGGPDARGESTAAGHNEEIQVLSFSWGASNNSAQAELADTGNGKVSVQDFAFTKRLDRASPALAQACCSGARFSSVSVAVCKSSGDRGIIAQFKFEDVLLTSYQASGMGDGSDSVPQESLMLQFARFTMGYRPLNAQGASEKPVFGGWDVRNNTPSGTPFPLR